MPEGGLEQLGDLWGIQKGVREGMPEGAAPQRYKKMVSFSSGICGIQEGGEKEFLQLGYLWGIQKGEEGIPEGVREGMPEGAAPQWCRKIVSFSSGICKKINKSHSHTHRPRTTPPTPTHAHTTRTTPQTPKRTPPTNT